MPSKKGARKIDGEAKKDNVVSPVATASVVQQSANETESNQTNESTKEKESERKKFISLPPEMVGKRCEGVVSKLIWKSKNTYGFINLGTTSDPDSLIFYFKPSSSSEKLKKGDIVIFTCEAGENERPVAVDIDLKNRPASASPETKEPSPTSEPSKSKSKSKSAEEKKVESNSKNGKNGKEQVNPSPPAVDSAVSGKSKNAKQTPISVSSQANEQKQHDGSKSKGNSAKESSDSKVNSKVSKGASDATNLSKGGEAVPKPEKEEPKKDNAFPISVVNPKLIGKKFTGTVTQVIRTKRFNFGFITKGEGAAVEKPDAYRFYYNPTMLPEGLKRLSLGTIVTFTARVDENQRPIAEDITIKTAESESLAKPAAVEKEQEQKPKKKNNKSKSKSSEESPATDLAIKNIPTATKELSKNTSPADSSPEPVLGSLATGTVINVVRKKGLRFGFISATGNASDSVKYYYKESFLSEGVSPLQKGDTVEFKVAKDEENRLQAHEITLKVKFTKNEAIVKENNVVAKDSIAVDASGDQAPLPKRKRVSKGRLGQAADVKVQDDADVKGLDTKGKDVDPGNVSTSETQAKSNANKKSSRNDKKERSNGSPQKA